MDKQSNAVSLDLFKILRFRYELEVKCISCARRRGSQGSLLASQKHGVSFSGDSLSINLIA